jgi:hypothetical protein
MIESDLVEILGGDPEPVDVPRDHGAAQRIYRCRRCQVAVFSEYGWPELWYIRAGTLDEPSSISPDVHIYTKSKLSWVELPESVPSFDVYYERSAVWSADSNQRLDAVIARRDQPAT